IIEDQPRVVWAKVALFWDQIPWDRIGCVSKYSLAGACLGALGIPLATGAILLAFGFTAAGIRILSFAAWLMSLYGGNTPVGGIVATMQSIGARG
ncbi:hypothetical protein EC957_001382, partial [Mortierella hygrophila]